MFDLVQVPSILMNHITSSTHFFNKACHFHCVARYSSILAENTPEWLYFSSAGYHTVDHSFYSYFTLLSNLLFLHVFFEYFTSYLDWTLVARLRYLVWLVLTMDSYASRSTQTAIWFGSLITYFHRYLERTWGVLMKKSHKTVTPPRALMKAQFLLISY